MASFKDALLRTAMMAATPESEDELYLIADALSLWQKHPELRSAAVNGIGVTPDRMLARIAMVLALIKFGVEPMPDLPDCSECGMNLNCKPSCKTQTYPIHEDYKPPADKYEECPTCGATHIDGVDCFGEPH